MMLFDNNKAQILLFNLITSINRNKNYSINTLPEHIYLIRVFSIMDREKKDLEVFIDKFPYVFLKLIINKQALHLMLSRAAPLKISKNLVIQDERSQKIKVISLDVPVIDQHIPLREFFYQIIPELSTKIVKTYDFLKDSYVNLTELNYYLPVTFLHSSNLIIFKIFTPQFIHTSSNPSTVTSQDVVSQKSETSSHKKERSKERVIFQVIQIVKKWRQIHNSKNNLKKMSLQQAAKMVGLPKKSLDDYYYQLRLGEKYDFDFRAHLFDRVGVLRTYLKNIKQNYKLDKNEKHPKKLKIIDQFDQIQEIFNRNKQQMRGNNFEQMEEEQGYDQDFQQMKMEHSDNNDQNNRGIQHQFYNEFQYLMNQKDPFLACDYNFKKKGMEEGEYSGDFFF